MDRRLRCATVVFVGFFSVLAAGLPALSAAPESSQLWDSAVARVSEGRFHEARSAVDRLVEAGGADERTTRMHTWLSAFDELQEQRQEMAQADYEKYVGWVKKRAEAGQWDKAVNWLFAAFLSCEDREVFRQEPWVLKTVEQAMAHAETLREKGEWIEAIRIYGAFDEIFTPNGEVYHQLRKLCQLHILLEETYRADRQWKDDVRDIEPGMAHRALLLVSERYVTEPDFARMTLSALERLVTLAATKKLAETFPSMQSAELVEEFSRRIGYHIRRLRDEERVTLHRAVALFDRALEVNNDTLRIPQEVVIAEFMEGALEPLDEFSSMIWPAEFDAFRKETMGEFSGVGIQITLENRILKVISPLEDTPAYDAGIQPGDVITKVDGETTVGISIDQAVRRITGPVLTNVVLTIRRAGVEEEFDVSIQRDRIKIRTVKGVSREVNGQWNCWADPDMKIAYVRLTGFMEDTAAELSDQLDALRRDGMRGVILDLRFNPGGLLKTAVEICDLLLPADRVIVSTKGRASSPQEVSSSRRNGLMDVPMIVLVNDISASASEIVSGAIQDHHRGLIVGERTFGKGLVQNLEALGGPSGASYIKLTTAKYYLPNGRCIQKESGNAIWGVDPDVLVSLVPKEMRRVLELRRKGDVLKGKNQAELSLEALDFDDTEPEGAMEDDEAATSQPTTTQAADAEDEKDENIHPEIDPQYEAALLVMRVRLLSNEPWSIESKPVTAKAASR